MQCCCDESARDPSVPVPVTLPPSRNRRKSWRRRITAPIQWAIPIATLALIPKCPACVAAYVLLFSGVGLSFSVASRIRLSLITLSIAAMAYLLFRTAKRFRHRVPAGGHHS